MEENRDNKEIILGFSKGIKKLLKKSNERCSNALIRLIAKEYLNDNNPSVLHLEAR